MSCAERRYCWTCAHSKGHCSAREVWEKSQPAGEAEWQSLAWQRVTAARRYAEWARHLGELGLAMEEFGDDRVLDVGCGPTGIVYFLDAAARVGVDPMADLYAQWNGYTASQSLSSRRKRNKCPSTISRSTRCSASTASTTLGTHTR